MTKKNDDMVSGGCFAIGKHDLLWENFPDILCEEAKRKFPEGKYSVVGSFAYSCFCGATCDYIIYFKRDGVLLQDCFCVGCHGMHRFSCPEPGGGLCIKFYNKLEDLIMENVLTGIHFVPYVDTEHVSLVVDKGVEG